MPEVVDDQLNAAPSADFAYDPTPAEIAAWRMRNALQPAFGRQEGQASRIAGHLPALVGQSLLDTVTAPFRYVGDVMEGRLDPLSQEGIGGALGTAMAVSGGRMPFVRRGELGVGGGKLGEGGVGTVTTAATGDPLMLQLEADLNKALGKEPPIAEGEELKHVYYVGQSGAAMKESPKGFYIENDEGARGTMYHPHSWEALSEWKQSFPEDFATAVGKKQEPEVAPELPVSQPKMTEEQKAAYEHKPSKPSLGATPVDEDAPRDLARTSADFAEAQLESEKKPEEGSNFGGFYKLPDGSKWYIKEAPHAEHAQNEKLGGELYRVAGAFTPITHAIEFHGKPAVASKMLENFEPIGAPENAPPSFGERVASDIWLKNYDAIGTKGDNLFRDQWGNVARLDQGATLNFRANGAKKGSPLTPDATEDWYLMTGKAPSEEKWASSKYARAAQAMPKEALQRSVWRLSGVTDEEIKNSVADHGFGTPEEKKQLADLLVSRRDSVLAAAKSDGYTTHPETRQEIMDTFFPQDVVRGSARTELKPGTAVNASYKRGIFGTTSPELAGEYAGTPHPTIWTAGENGPNLWPMRWNTENFLHVDAKGAVFYKGGDYIRNFALGQAAREGRDGVVIHNIWDEPSGDSQALDSPKDVYIALKGANVRSRTGAEFNPKKWRLNDFTAALGGVVLPAGVVAHELMQDKDGKFHAVQHLDESEQPPGVQ